MNKFVFAYDCSNSKVRPCLAKSFSGGSAVPNGRLRESVGKKMARRKLGASLSRESRAQFSRGHFFLPVFFASRLTI